MNEGLKERIAKIRLLLMDCDGVLTDGRLYYNDKGEELKVFHVHDGQGIADWHNSGFISGVITGRNSKALERRADELGIPYLKQGSKDKVKDFEEILHLCGCSAEETAYIGDDTPDLPLLRKAGFSAVPANAIESVKEAANYICKEKGGMGAVRELIDLLLDGRAAK